MCFLANTIQVLTDVLLCLELNFKVKLFKQKALKILVMNEHQLYKFGN